MGLLRRYIGAPIYDTPAVSQLLLPILQLLGVTQGIHVKSLTGSTLPMDYLQAYHTFSAFALLQTRCSSFMCLLTASNLHLYFKVFLSSRRMPTLSDSTLAHAWFSTVQHISNRSVSTWFV